MDFIEVERTLDGPSVSVEVEEGVTTVVWIIPIFFRVP